MNKITLEFLNSFSTGCTCQTSEVALHGPTDAQLVLPHQWATRVVQGTAAR